MDDDQIILCADCNEPLVMTFLWPGKEWFCCSCHKATEFFGHHHYADATEAMVNRAKEIERIFMAATKDADNPHKAALAIEIPR